MGYTPKILAFAGSTRTDSFNKKLIKIAVQGAKDKGASVTLVDLRDYPMPLYDGDLEKDKGLPEKAKELKKIFLEHQGLMISSPEYNASMPGMLKNTLDWVSRKEGNEPELACYIRKVAVLMSASPGGLGGLRGLVHLRAMLTGINVLVLPQQVSVSRAAEAFDTNGLLKDEKVSKAVQKLGADLTEMLTKLNA